MAGPLSGGEIRTRIKSFIHLDTVAGYALSHLDKVGTGQPVNAQAGAGKNTPRRFMQRVSTKEGSEPFASNQAG